MKDLNGAIAEIFNHCVPIKYCDKQIGYVVEKERLEILLAEYNIHFIEPEDKQMEIEKSSYMFSVTEKNVMIS